MSASQFDALMDWIRSAQRLGLLVIGQPIVSRRATSLVERFDNSLADYAEFAPLLLALRRRIEGDGVSFVVLTGDIHWGRLLFWWPPSQGRAKLLEFVASPVARVATPNILSDRFVGAPEDTALRLNHFPLFNELFKGFSAAGAFATNENNFGLLEIAADGADFRADFTLVSLDTQKPATNAWKDRVSTCEWTVQL